MKQIIPNPVKVPDWYRYIQGENVVWRGFTKANTPEKTLLLGTGGVTVKIYPDKEIECQQIGWLVEYTIQHSLYSSNSGILWFSTDDLKTAFGFSSECVSQMGQTLVNRYGGDVAALGKYIRAGDYLNIPGPGHGFDDDPNLSIRITEQIKQAVAELMRRPQ